ncbi:phycocyanobilin:ferredoxin oxidoreductase [Pleurocapsales cyanobacterium LEGE 10410]|nr:phycocyanobilin:ferredoxin oxidoreductase [Pleurocapsales cyanobacterium LEGE 10410]
MVAIFKSSLRERQHQLIQQLANSIEEQWIRYLDLSPYQIPDDLGYVEGNLEEEKLIIENRCYQTTQFRKLHLELAQVGNRLDILHCVMFPRSNYNLPIFGVDLVGSPAGIGAAIVDLSPVNRDRILDPIYTKALTNLPPIDFARPRTLPPWGNIFSKFCLFIQPQNNLEEKLFLQRVLQYLAIHCNTALATRPSIMLEAQILAGQRYYCQQQQQNDKTRRVLEKSLGKPWTDRYVTQMLFDCP